MFLFTGAKKGAEMLGIIDDAVEEIVEEQPETVSAEKPKAIKMKAIDIKPVGNVSPYVKIIDPADDLAKLEEVFGVYRSGEKMLVLECEECGHEARIPFKGVDLEDDCACSECGFEGIFDDFYEGSSTDPSTSRTPTDEELWLLTEGALENYPSYWNDASWDKLRSGLMDYYSVLKGDLPTLAEKSTENDAIDVGYNGVSWRIKCRGCQDPGDTCTCQNNRMRFFNKLYSVSEVRAAAQPEED